MGRPANPRHYRAKESCTGDINGEVFVLSANAIYAHDDPVRLGRPELFTPLEAERSRPLVEQATAAPGERRGE